MTQSDFRIREHPILGVLDETGAFEIEFDGQPVAALPGDTVASALLASGHRVFRTTPKTGEARGGFCMVGRCADCLMIIDGVPSVRACMIPARPGMKIRTQHGLGDWNVEAPR